MLERSGFLTAEEGRFGPLKNWRPVALLCTDYKILSRALSNRLRLNIELMVHIGILSLDLEKAFDRIDHTCLFSVFHAFGVGDVFTSRVKLLYNGASCMVKVAGG